MKTNKTLQQLFSFSGFRAKQALAGKFGDFKARIIELDRQKKQQYVRVVKQSTKLFMIRKKS